MSVARLAGVFALVLVAASCAAPQEAPRDQFYRLSVDFQGSSPQAPVLQGTLQVDRFLADGLLIERALVYSSVEAPDRLMQYHYHYWTEALPRMLQGQLVSYLRGANVAGTIVTTEQRADPDYSVGAKLRRMEQIVRPGNPLVALTMEFSLRRESDGKLMLIKVYEVEREAPDRTMTGTVSAMNAAVSDVYAAFTRDLGIAAGG
ncbi:MAG: ABC-type transport auxiliary lipoprotein family protein [Acetobacterales bacterium]